MGTDKKYLVAVVLLAVLAVAFGAFGTAAPPLAEEVKPSESSSSSSSSVAHFTNPPTYDSGWINRVGMEGKNFTLTHSLNTTELVTYVTGKGFDLSTAHTMAWNRTYGGTSADYGYSVVETSDGGYAIAGYTFSFGSYYQMYLVKTDASGTIVWNRTYGGTNSDYGYSVVETSDGGYAIAGYTDSFGSGYQAYLVKTYADGTMAWNKTYGGTNSDRGYSVVQTSDGGYIVAGETNSFGSGYQAYLVKTFADGIMAWNKTYGGTSNDYAYYVVETRDGGYAIAGYTNSYGVGTPTCDNVYLVKTYADGTMAWNKTYGGTDYDRGYSVVQTNDGGYAIGGYTYSFGSAHQVYLVKTDSVGNMAWNKTYGGTSIDIGYSVAQTNDGGYIVAGYTDSFGSGYQAYLVKTYADGTMAWNKTYGGTSADYGYSVVQTSDGGYAIAGYTMSYGAGSWDFWLAKWPSPTMREHQRNFGTETGLTIIDLTNKTITLYRGLTDKYWQLVRVRIWLIKEPTWIYGDINMDGVVDTKDLYILGRNYGKSVSLLSLTGIAAVAGIRTVKKRKQNKQSSYIS